MGSVLGKVASSNMVKRVLKVNKSELYSWMGCEKLYEHKPATSAFWAYVSCK